AEVSRNCRGIRERLVEIPHHVREGLRTIGSADPVSVMIGLEFSSRDFGITELVKALLLETDGERLHRTPAEPAHHAHYRAAIGAAAQVRPYTRKVVVLAIAGHGLGHHVGQFTAQPFFASALSHAIAHIPEPLE